MSADGAVSTARVKGERIHGHGSIGLSIGLSVACNPLAADLLYPQDSYCRLSRRRDVSLIPPLDEHASRYSSMHWKERIMLLPRLRLRAVVARASMLFTHRCSHGIVSLVDYFNRQ